MTNNAATPPAMPLQRRISRNVSWSLLAESIGKGAVFLVMIHLARALGSEAFGQFSFLYTLFMVLWVGVDLGLEMYGSREVARRRHEDSQLISAIIAMRLTIAVVIGLVTLSLLLLLADDAASRELALAFTLYLVLRAVYLDWYLRGREHYRALALISSLVALGLVAIAWLGVESSSDLSAAGWPWAAGYALGVVGVVIYLRRQGLSVSLRRTGGIKQWLSHWSESIHFTLANGIGLLYQNLPVFYLYAFAGASLTGQYAAAFRVVMAGVFVFSIIPMAIYPVFADLFERREPQFITVARKATAFLAIAVIVASPVIALLADWLVTTLLGAEYLPSVSTLRVLLLFLCLRAVRAVYVRALSAAGRQRDYTKVMTGAVVGLAALLGAITVWDLALLVYTPWSLVVVESAVLVAMWLLVSTRIYPEVRPATTGPAK